MATDHHQDDQSEAEVTPSETTVTDESTDAKPEEIGGPKGPEPTRYGDWEKAGRCIDF